MSYRFIIRIWTAFMGLTLTSQATSSFEQNLPPTSGSFAIVGDTQQTLFIEQIFFREKNMKETRALLKNISQKKPQFAIFLGDFVGYGASNKHWRFFDEITADLKSNNTAILGAIGNHDYFGGKKRALPKVYKRFSELSKSHWYSKVYQSIGLIFLDSNFKRLSDGEQKTQYEWLKQTLNEFENNDQIRGILIFSHHPPFTNSKIVRSEKTLQKDYVPLLNGIKKKTAFITGHAHGYEHFIKNETHFIVSAGGGGPRANYRTGSKAKYTDLAPFKKKRPFNYLWVTPLEDSIKIEVMGLSQDLRQTSVVDQIHLVF